MYIYMKGGILLEIDTKNDLYNSIFLIGFFIFSIVCIICLFLDDKPNYCYIDYENNLNFSNICKNSYCQKDNSKILVKEYIDLRYRK